MVKVLYLGDITPCRIMVLNTRINDWKKGEVKELGEKEASKLINDNKNFSYTDKKLEERKKEKVEEKSMFDLDGDGDVDSQDYSIAAKTLAHARKKQ